MNKDDQIIEEHAAVLIRHLALLASGSRSYNAKAAEVYHMNEIEFIDWANNKAMPIYKEFGCPIPSQGRYLEYQDAIRSRLF